MDVNAELKAPSKAVFVFPGASGHVNPSLPLARGLVKLGWQVEYVAGAAFKAAIQNTGAQYVDRDVVFQEVLREHGVDSTSLLIQATFAEYSDPPPMWGINFGSIAVAWLLQPFITWLDSRSVSLVVYCPVLSQLARFAAARLNIPHVSLLTTAGPGYWDAVFAAHSMSADALVRAIHSNTGNADAVAKLQQQLATCLPELTLNTREDVPLVFDYYCSQNLITTIPSLADPLNARDAKLYEVAGKMFTFVGPLLDTKQQTTSSREQSQDEDGERVMAEVKAAVNQGRKVVYVSMGTVVTSDHPDFGWNGTNAGASCMTGKQVCQSVYRAVFAAVNDANDGMSDCKTDQKQLQSGEEKTPPTTATAEPVEQIPLVVVSLGTQSDALEGITVPNNAICVRRVPQVALLRLAKPVLFVTNGGQNSLTEGMTVGIPFVVCPGFGDQVSNAAKIQARGLGLKVDRPGKPATKAASKSSKSSNSKTADRDDTLDHDEKVRTKAAALAGVEYEAAVHKAVRDVLSGGEQYANKGLLRTVSMELANAGGVDQAIRVLLQTAAAPH